MFTAIKGVFVCSTCGSDTSRLVFHRTQNNDKSLRLQRPLQGIIQPQMIILLLRFWVHWRQSVVLSNSDRHAMKPQNEV